MPKPTFCQRAKWIVGLALALAISAGPARADSPKAEARRAFRLYESGQYAEAARVFGLARELARERGEPDPALDYNLGTAFARQGEFDQSIEVLEEAAERPGQELPDALLEDAYYNLGVARNLKFEKLEGGQDPLPLAEAHREIQKALEAFRRALMFDPNGADARHNYAVTYRRLKELEASMEQPPSPPPQQGEDEPSPSQEPPPSDSQDDGMQGDDAGPPPSPDGEPDQADGEDGQDREAGDSTDGDSPEPPTPDEADPQTSDEAGERDEPAPESSRQESGLEDAPGPSPTPSPTPSPGAQGANGRDGDAGASGAAEGADSPEMTQEQLDALRVLNALEQDRPDQFRRMFRFRGDAGKKLERDW